MGDIKVVEGTFQIDDVNLYTKSWLPNDTPIAKLIVIHGFSDHINRYDDFSRSLARRGIEVHGFDQRGWGRSVRKPSDKGRSGPTATVLSDMAAFLRSKLPPPSPSPSSSSSSPSASGETNSPPVFVLGHSMGGGQILTFASTPEHEGLVSQVRGWIAVAPFLGFAPAVQPSWLTVASGRLAAHVLPHFQLHRPVPPEHLSRDPAVRASIAEDPLMHNTGTLEGFAGMIDRAESLSGGKLSVLRRPAVKSLFLAHGTADMVASFPAVKDWWARQGPQIEDARAKWYDGFVHELHLDLGRNEFYRDVADWIDERSGAGGSVDVRESVGNSPEPKL
ncbi:hypothetical protein M426DRAFT_320080 [Hypoxylon sp. CI-4A]|nr:hypothetical protein M426DRAFT_320080 [Hypoxylon sp. CI-4A]